MLERNKSEALCLLGLEQHVQIFPLFEKISVNTNVLSFNLKLFRTKVDMKSLIRDYSLRIYVVNVQSLSTCKSKCSIEISRNQGLT